MVTESESSSDVICDLVLPWKKKSFLKKWLNESTFKRSLEGPQWSGLAGGRVQGPHLAQTLDGGKWVWERGGSKLQPNNHLLELREREEKEHERDTHTEWMIQWQKGLLAGSPQQDGRPERDRGGQHLKHFRFLTHFSPPPLKTFWGGSEGFSGEGTHLKLN